MQNNETAGQSHAWRFLGVLLLLAACAATGWMIGHATAWAAPVIQEIAHVADGLTHAESHQVVAGLGH
jgi:hypothetical protein